MGKGLITLTSDWGTKDYYAAAVKGTIYKYNPEAVIIDISHSIQQFDSAEAAYVLRNASSSFPEGTIHIIGVNTEESLAHPHIIAYYKKQYFIGADDGIFALIFDEEPEKIISLDIPMETSNHTFSSRDRFAKAAAMLSTGTSLKDLGEEKDTLVNKMHFNPVIQENSLKGMIIHIDNYENLITNITRESFKEFTTNTEFEISFRNQKYKVTKIYESYGDVRPGEIVALFTSDNILEIAINKGNAASLLGIDKSDPIVVTKNG